MHVVTVKKTLDKIILYFVNLKKFFYSMNMSRQSKEILKPKSHSYILTVVLLFVSIHDEFI